MFKVNDKETRIWTDFEHIWNNFEHISHLIVLFLLLTLNMQLPTGLFRIGVYLFKVNIRNNETICELCSK